MLARLRTIQVHPALKDYLLPELPPSERSGTLADWANASELLETHAMLDEDVEQMKVRRPEEPQNCKPPRLALRFPRCTPLLPPLSLTYPLFRRLLFKTR